MPKNETNYLPDRKQPGLTTSIQVVATGLNVPRGLVYDLSGQRLLIAEAGVAAGNTGPCATGDESVILCDRRRW